MLLSGGEMHQQRTRRLQTALAAFAIALLGGGCTGPEATTESEATFTRLYPMEMNVRISYVGPPVPTLKEPCGEVVDVAVLNTSEDPVYLPSGSKPDLWTYSSQERTWIPVEDRLIRTSEQSRVVEPKGGDVPFWPVTFLPAVECGTPSMVIRVVVVGTVLKGDAPTGVQTGAFVDIAVDPESGEWTRTDVMRRDPDA